MVQSESWRTLIFLTILNFFLFTRKFQITIDQNRKLLTDKNQIFGLNYKIRKANFEQLHHIQIDKKRHQYTANSRFKTGATDYFEYIGSLVFDDNKTFEFRRSVGYKILKKDVQRVADVLKIEVIRIY